MIAEINYTYVKDEAIKFNPDDCIRAIEILKGIDKNRYIAFRYYYGFKTIPPQVFTNVSAI